MTDRTDHGAPRDDDFGADPFADVRDGDTEAASTDPFDLEPVLDDDYQNTPNSYNVRNIVLIAAGGFVLVLVAFLFSLGGGDEAGRLAVDEGANSLPLEATPPDVTMRPVQAGPAYPEEDLSLLLDDPVLAAGGSGGYGAPAPRAAAPSGPSEPTYRDLRREAFLAAIGKPARRSVEDMPAGQAQPAYVVDAMGNVIGPAPGTDIPNAVYGNAASGQAGGPGGGMTQFASQRGGRAAPRGAGGAARRPAGPQAQAEFTDFTLPQGTLINVALETEVNSDIDGVIIARTVEDIYDRTRRHVVIPRGSQIVSVYGGGDVVGECLVSTVSRLNLPDGRSVDFSNADLHDLQGRRCLKDIVNRHTGSKIGAGLLQAAAGIGSAVAGRRVRREVVLIRNPDGSTSEVPLADDVSAEAARRGADGANDAVRSSTQRTLERPNTVILRAGLRALVVVTDDIDMGRPYYNFGPVPTGRSPFDVRPSPRTRPAGAPVRPNGPNIPPPPPVRTPVRTASGG
ncbi:MAG: TrbI/VirB10 family protein [Myxococcota bacterium]